MVTHDRKLCFIIYGKFQQVCDNLFISSNTNQERLNGTNFVNKNVFDKKMGKHHSLKSVKL